MVAGTWILFALGLLGALDIAMYHSAAHGIRSHPDSRAELITHSLRGPTYATLFIIVPNFAMHGVFFWLLIALYAVDVIISIVDFALERESREFLGGLPSGEYVLHTLIAMLFGALVATSFFEAGNWAFEPTAIFYAPADVPWVLRLVMAIMAAVVLYSGLQDLMAAIRLPGQPHRAEASPATDND